MGEDADPLIRRSRTSEWRALRALRLRSLETDPLAFGSTLAHEAAFDDTEWRKRALDSSESSTFAQWVAEEASGQIVGCVVIAEFDGKVGVYAMWVEPRVRGRGIGARLLDAGLRWAGMAFPGRDIQLDVNPRQTAAIQLYESRGFRRSAPDRPLGHTPGELRFEMIRPATASNPSA
jgi:ribosomal protein S18 acetylase RimI-like enzyme